MEPYVPLGSGCSLKYSALAIVLSLGMEPYSALAVVLSLGYMETYREFRSCVKVEVAVLGSGP